MIGIVVEADKVHVTAIIGAGSCPDARIRCMPRDFTEGFVPGCARYQVVPRRAGACELTVQYVGGTASFVRSVRDDTAKICATDLWFVVDDPRGADVTVKADAGAPDSGTSGDVTGASAGGSTDADGAETSVEDAMDGE